MNIPPMFRPFLKGILQGNGIITKTLSCFCFLFLNRIRGKNRNDLLDCSSAFLIRCKINFLGKSSELGSSIQIGKSSRLINCTFNIGSHDCSVIIGQGCALRNATFHLEDAGSNIIIGNGTNIFGTTHIAAIEGKSVVIGKNCLFSSNVDLRNGDSHSVIDLDGNRINPSQDVYIGDHVWLCKDSSVVKGSVGNNTIIGYRAVVTKIFEESNVALGGVPAQVVKRNINWNNQRI